GLAKAIDDVADRTRNNKIGPDELAGGTFTVTNIGSVGALFDTPIINQPQMGIIGTGAIVRRPIAVKTADGDESIAIRDMVYLPLTYNHQLVDGADAGRFLQTIKSRLEEGNFEADLDLLFSIVATSVEGSTALPVGPSDHSRPRLRDLFDLPSALVSFELELDRECLELLGGPLVRGRRMHPSTGHNAVGARVDDPDIVDGDRVVDAREGRRVDEFIGRGRGRARHCQRLQARFVTIAERSCPGRAEILEHPGHLTFIGEHV